MQLILGLFFIFTTACAIAQQYSTIAPVLPDAVQRPSPESPNPETSTLTSAGAASLPDAPSYTTQQPSIDASKRIPGVVANSNTVGSGTTPLSPMSKPYLNVAMPNGVGNLSLAFSALTAVNDPHRQLDGGTNGSAINCSRGSADKTDGGGWINSLLSITSKGGHYCALGEGGFWKRGTYAATRAFAAHRYDGANSFNVSDAFGRGSAPVGTAGYYSYQNYSGERLAARYASAVGRDALKNMFREFWPDISTRVLHRRP